MQLDDVAVAITTGDFDDDLGALFEVLFARAKETGVGFGWKLTLDGEEWTQESVTLAELAFAEQSLSLGTKTVSYLELDPLRHMDHCVALVVAHLHKANGLKVADAFARAEKLTVMDLKDLVSAYQVEVPKDDGAASATS